MGIAAGNPFHTPFEMAKSPLSLFQSRLQAGIQRGELHLLVPAGVGNNLWIVGKLWRLCQERNVTFWLPPEEQRRSADVFRMMGLRYGYMPDLTTEWIWSRPGSPPIPDTGAVLSIQPNRHLEHGHRIEKWYPEYEFRNPVQFMDSLEVPFHSAVGPRNYVVVFTSQQGYMEYGGNLKPAQWGRIFKHIEQNVGPVVLIGAGKDVEFCKEVGKYFDPSIEPVLNAPLDTIAGLMANAQMVIGAHAGPLILSTYMGIPTLHAMPRWLAPMPGTWEAPDNIWGACFLDELENVVRDGVEFNGVIGAQRMRQLAYPSIRALGKVHERWTNPAVEAAEREAAYQRDAERKQAAYDRELEAQEAKAQAKEAREFGSKAKVLSDEAIDNVFGQHIAAEDEATPIPLPHSFTVEDAREGASSG